MPQRDYNDYDRPSRRNKTPDRPRAVPESTAAGPTTKGRIKTLNLDRGFGFIKDDSGQEYFFHRSETAGAFDTLEQGEVVLFNPQASSKGPRAHQVRREGAAGLPDDADDHNSDD